MSATWREMRLGTTAKAIFQPVRLAAPRTGFLAAAGIEDRVDTLARSMQALDGAGSTRSTSSSSPRLARHLRDAAAPYATLTATLV